MDPETSLLFAGDPINSQETWGLEIDCQPTCGGCSARLEPGVLKPWKVLYKFFSDKIGGVIENNTHEFLW